MSYTEQALQQIQQTQLETATAVGEMKSDIKNIKESQAKNTEQISEIRQKLPLPQSPLSELISKFWPLVTGLLVGAAAVGTLIAGKF